MFTESDIDYLGKALPFLNNLDGADIRLIASTGSRSGFGQGEVIMNREMECNGLVIVKSGQLRAYFESEDGKGMTLYRLLPQDACILTASCILKNVTFEVNLEAEKNSEVYFIPAVVWKELTEKNVAVREFSMELMSGRFSEVMWVVEQMVSKNIGQRIASFLLEQSVLEDSQTLETTHDTIAKNIGTAREVISRTLKYFENDGILKLSRGKIHLSDIKRLRELSR